MKTCPLTGEICNNSKSHTITETNGNLTFQLCDNCFPGFAEKMTAPFSKKSLFEKVKNFIFKKRPTQEISIAPQEEKPPISQEEKPPVQEEIKIDPMKLEIKIPGAPSQQLIDVISEIEARIDQSQLPPMPQLECPLCGFTFYDLTVNSRIGCGTCYEIFANYVNPLIYQYHGSSQHEGKYPQHFEERQAEEFFDEVELTQYKIGSLEDKLAAAIEQEEYENAIVLRDTIASLKTKLNDLRPKTSEDQ